MVIPVIDFQLIRRHLQDGGEGAGPLEMLHQALSAVGFVYLSNHGIGEELIQNAFETAAQFFSLPLETKKAYLRTKNTDNGGYVQLEQESGTHTASRLEGVLQHMRQKQCLKHWPTEVPSFHRVTSSLFTACLRCAMEVLEAMGHCLQLENSSFFVKTHSRAGQGSEVNFTTLRLLHYPPLPAEEEVKPGQVHCGEHVDYGSITLLFQDSNGGLQVRCADDSYIQAPYIPGTVLVNLGALMQQWTSDKYLATVARQRTRQSIAFFVHPDNDTLVTCIDGSNKYPPITAGEDIARRFAASYSS